MRIGCQLHIRHTVFTPVFTYFWLAGLLPAVPGPGRTSQAAGQTRAERPQMVCDRGNRADELRPRVAGQGGSDRGKADSGDEREAEEQGAGSGPC